MTPHADSDIVPPCDGTSLINSPDSARVMSRLVDTLIVLYMKSDPLSRALRFVKQCPISWRKQLVRMVQLGVCRPQKPWEHSNPCIQRLDDEALRRMAATDKVLSFHRYAFISEEEIRDIVEPILQFHSYRSIIWMFCRCLPEPARAREREIVAIYVGLMYLRSFRNTLNRCLRTSRRCT